MDGNLTLEIVTIVIAILSIFINVIFSIIMARKTKYAEITITQRIENLHNATTLTEKLIYMSSAEYIANSKDISELSCRFVETRDKLLYYYMRPFPETKEIVSAMKSFSDEWFYYVKNQAPENFEKLNQYREVLFTLTKVNEIAYWHFVLDHYKLNIHTKKQFINSYTKVRSDYADDGFCISKSFSAFRANGSKTLEKP